MFLRGDVQTHRAGELVVDVKPEQMDIAGLVEWIRKHPPGVRGDRPFADIGLIPQAENRITFLGAIRAPEIDPVYKLGETIGKTAFQLSAIRNSETRYFRTHNRNLRVGAQVPQLTQVNS